MRNAIRFIADRRNSIAGLLVIIIAVLLYESGQQLYFVRQYEIVEDPSYWKIMWAQCRRWLVWMALLPILVYSFRSMAAEVRKLQLAASVLATCLIAIVAVSILEMIIQQGVLVDRETFVEYVTFFFYQKGPIYLLGYISISFVILSRSENRRLRFEMHKIGDLRLENENLARRIQELKPSEEQVLSIRIGKKQKIVPLSDVLWIEADDYCAKVHSIDGRSYSMRISLKSLEENLSSPFMRVHRSAIVNLAQIEEIVRTPKPQAILSSGVKVPIAKTRLNRVAQSLTASFLQ